MLVKLTPGRQICNKGEYSVMKRSLQILKIWWLFLSPYMAIDGNNELFFILPHRKITANVA